MDKLTPEQRSALMALVRGKNTQPELAVRRLIWGLGYRYRLHQSDLPGKPDIVLPGRRKIIFVHGCFWHRHPRCRRASLPATRKEFWIPKLRINQLRDRKNLTLLRNEGWNVLVIWECELRGLTHLEERLSYFLTAENGV